MKQVFATLILITLFSCNSNTGNRFSQSAQYAKDWKNSGVISEGSGIRTFYYSKGDSVKALTVGPDGLVIKRQQYIVKAQPITAQ
jgi:hypothetical protein